MQVLFIGILSNQIMQLGLFYYLLGNISPQFRSSFKIIQLVSVVCHSLIVEYCVDKILEEFMETIKEVESVGIYIYIDDLHASFMFQALQISRMKE